MSLSRYASLLTEPLQIRGSPFRESQTLTVGTGAHADNDAYGGKLTFTTMVRANGTGGLLTNIKLFCLDRLTASDLIVHVFGADPSTSTITDDAAFVKTDADHWNLITEVTLSVLGGIEGDAASCYLEAANLDIPYAETSGSATSIFVAISTNASVTPVATAPRLVLTGFLD